MNKYQSVRLQMLELVTKEALNYPASVEGIPMFARGINRLRAITGDITQLNAQQSTMLAGITEKKNDAVENLVELLLEISGVVYSYAEMQNDAVLKGKVNVKISLIAHARLDKLIAVADTVLIQARSVPQGILADFGVSPEELSAFEAVLQEVKSLKSAPREATLERSGYTEQLSVLFDEANQLLKETLDKLAQQFKRKDPAFYAKYKTIRSMGTPGGSKSSSTATNPVVAE